ncbi:MAG TPA: DUF2147 domain-containing protein [Archangium sp.]|nr:DUF2147 domain-containing protein [Archangium sp.]
MRPCSTVPEIALPRAHRGAESPLRRKTYKVKLAVEDGGKKLKVCGFIGIALIGRTQYWGRAE